MNIEKFMIVEIGHSNPRQKKIYEKRDKFV